MHGLPLESSHEGTGTGGAGKTVSGKGTLSQAGSHLTLNESAKNVHCDDDDENEQSIEFGSPPNHDETCGLDVHQSHDFYQRQELRSQPYVQTRMQSTTTSSRCSATLPLIPMSQRASPHIFSLPAEQSLPTSEGGRLMKDS